MTELELKLMIKWELSEKEVAEVIDNIKTEIKNGKDVEELLFELEVDPSYAVDLTL